MSESDAPISFGPWLRRRRRALDLTQVELARRVPCAKSTIRRIESDDLRPSKALAERLATILGIQAQSLPGFVAFARRTASGAQLDDSFAAPRQEPARGPKRRRYTLPAAAHPLLGRQHTAEVAVELLMGPDTRLVTLVGPPGVGKSRLALHIAEQVQDRFREGACFVALAPLRDGAGVLPAIAQAVELSDSGRLLGAALAERLRGEELLLVLDNFEHVIAAAPQIAALLAAAPALRILCTSRVPLRIVGEHEFVVPPLALPVSQQPLASVVATPAVALFVARARAVNTAFALTDENAQHVAEICLRLDGLPLAIELAANRTRLFSPQALLARLDRRLPFLTGGTRDAPARQRTLEAAIGWSYDLLGLAERRCLARLGLFLGGTDLESAEAVCGGDLDVVEALSALVDHNLLQPAHLAGGEVRFTMLETIREFALARLGELDPGAAFQERHARYFLGLAIEGERGLQGTDQVRWMRRLSADINNIRAAFAWSLTARGDIEPGLRAGAGLWWFWWTSGQVGEGRNWLAQLLLRAADCGLEQAEPYAQALLGAGILAFFAGDFASAMPLCAQARDLGAQRGDTITCGYAIFMIGTVMVLADRLPGGHDLLDEGAQLLRRAGEPAIWQIGVTSLARTLLCCEQGDLEAARRHADAGMTIFRQLGQPYGIGLALNYQGDVARLRGDQATAAARYQASLPLLRAANARSEIPAVLHNLAHVLLAQGDVAQACALLVEGLELHREIGNRMGVAECLVGLAAALIERGQAAPAARLLGAADAQLAALNMPLFATDQAIYQRAAGMARAALGDSAYAEARRAGRSLRLAEAVDMVSSTPADPER